MIALQHIYKSYEDKKILDDINFAINPSEVTALIGGNGAGKTTILKIILGQIIPDRGIVSLNHEIVGYLPQEFQFDGEMRESFDEGTEEWRKEYALELVGLSAFPKNTLIQSLSGGEKTRVGLATILARNPEPTVLLLDEPTNNLDTEGLLWLEQFIGSFKGGVVLISHDRQFINRVSSKVIELDKGKIRQYGGDYDFYKKQKEIEFQTELQEYEQFTDEKKRLRQIRNQKVAQLQESSSVRFDKMKHEHKMTFNTAKDATERGLGKKLKALDSRIERLGSHRRPENNKEYPISVSGGVQGSKMVVRLEHIYKSYDKKVLEDISLEIRGAEHCRVKGFNGSGKTTFLKIAMKSISPDSGEVSIGNEIKIGYFSQDIDGLDYELSGLENIQVPEISLTDIYRKARSMGLTENELQKKPKELSRGQQAKLGFIKLLLESNQLLILDEPTNHLDIPTRERIESVIREYEGAILVASHDEYFLDQIGMDKVFVV